MERGPPPSTWGEGEGEGGGGWVLLNTWGVNEAARSPSQFGGAGAGGGNC